MSGKFLPLRSAHVFRRYVGGSLYCVAAVTCKLVCGIIRRSKYTVYEYIGIRNFKLIVLKIRFTLSVPPT